MTSERAAARGEGPQRSHVQRAPWCFKLCTSYCSCVPVPVGQLGANSVTWGQSCLPFPHSSM